MDFKGKMLGRGVSRSGKRRHAFPILSSIVLLAAAGPLAAQVFEQNSALSFTMVQGGPAPLAQIVPAAAANNSNFYFKFSASTSSGGNWLTVPTGVIETPASFLVSIDNAVSSTLSAGTYTGQVVVASYYGSVSETLPVNLNVVSAAQPSFASLPGGLSYATSVSGSVGSQVVQINNAGPGTLNWTLTTNTFNSANFLKVSAASGTAPSLVTISVVPQNLPGGGSTAGTFVGGLVFSSSTGSVTVPVAVTIGGTSFVQAAPLSFNMLSGGAGPLPQVIAGASSASAFDFVASAYSATSLGNWLTVTTNNLETPASPVIGVDPTIAPNLPVGVYTGEVVVNNYYTGTAPTMAIPVTLTVSSASMPFFDSIPGALNFFLPAKGTSPGGQTFQIRNAGSGTLNWTATTTTADGGNWLSVSSSTGTAPTLLTVQVNSQNLPGGGNAGTYNGNVLLESSGSTISVPITVSVGVTAFLPVTPLSAVIPVGGSGPAAQTTNAASTGSAFDFSTAIYTANGGSWLTVNTGTSETPNPVELGFNPSVVKNLPAGTYSGEVVLSSYYTGVAAAVTIPITLTVAPSSEPFFQDLSGGLQFSLSTGGASPGNQFLQIQNAGSGALNWTVTATTADGGNWLAVSPGSGTAPSVVTVGVLPQNLPGAAATGFYNGTLLFSSASGTASVPITVAVGENGFAQVSPLTFNMSVGGAMPLPQSFTTSSKTPFYFVVSSSTSTGGSWLSVVPSGTRETPDGITVTMNNSAASLLPAGSYTGEVVLTPYYAGTAGPLSVPVTLNIASTTQPLFDKVPGALQFTLQAHGANPASQVFQIRNAGAGTLNWTVVASTGDGGNWLTVSPGSGTAPSFVSVGVVAANLPGGGAPGTYNGSLLFENGAQVVTVPISVSVGVTALQQVNPISFTMPFQGNAPLAQVLNLTTLTSTAFDFIISSTSTNGDTWLQVTPTGTKASPQSLTISVDPAVASTLAAGTYMAEIVVTPYYAGTSAATLNIPITLTVAAPGTAFFDNIPGGLYYSAVASAGNPASQSFYIRNEGSGQLNWSAIATTADSGNWLTLSATNGTAPSSLSIGIVAQNLPGQGAVAGTYTGQVLLQSPNGSVTIPVTVVIGTTALIQSNGLVFNIPPGPTPQTLTIGQIDGGAASEIASVFTGNGGNWLTMSLVGSTSTPRSFTLTASSGLPPGQYTGEATFVGYYGAAGQTVQVTLNVIGKPPASITPVSGTPQSAVVNTAFAGPLVAVVKDSASAAVPGVSVTFSAPASGASGSFAGQASVTVVTDNSGNATSPTFTANATSGTYAVTAAVASLAQTALFSLTNTRPPLTSIAISAVNNPVTKGSFDQFTATGTYGDGSTANITSTVNWSSSNSAIATVNSNGLASALSVGTTNVTASLSGITSNTVLLNVTGAILNSIAISAASNSVAKGNTDQLTAIGTYSDNSSANITSQVSWSSSNTATATVNANGLATALAVGTSNASASLSGITSNSVTLTVTNAALNSIAISAASGSVAKGGTDQFTAIGTYSDSSTANVTSQVAWNSSSTEIAAINANGLATALAVGASNVTASLSGITSNTVALSVTSAVLNSIAISAASGTVTKGGTDQFTAIGTYSDNSSANITSQVAWSSSNTSIASVNLNGLANALAVGSTNVMASLNGIASNILVLNVTSPALTSIAISASITTVAKGGTDSFTATGTYSDSSTANITSQVAWNSSNTAIVAINSSGLATAVAPGMANITASLSGITSNSVTLTVTSPTLQSIAISTLNTSVVKGNTDPFSAIGTYSDGSTANITTQVTWNSSIIATATINGSGLATALAIGTTNITASLSGFTSNSITLTVTSPTLQSIAITAASTSVVKGNTDPFTATGAYSDGSTANITSQVVWHSSNTATATISTTGLATALATGTTNISASFGHVTSNTIVLTVTGLTLQSIAITAPSNSVIKGNTDQFTATATYSDGSTANITSQAAWSSSNNAAATINSNGLANALAAGITNITAALSGLTSNSFPLTVTQPAGPTVLSYSVLFGSQSYNLIGTTRNRLPWQVTGIRVIFSEPVTAANINSLTGLVPTSFSGLGTNTLTWTVSPVTIGLFGTSLTGSGPNAISDANGSALNNGAGFAQPFKVLWGDFGDDGYVTSADMVGVNNAVSASYNIFADINGDGVVSLSDVQAVRARLGSSQP